MKEEEKASEHRQRKIEAEEADKVEVATWGDCIASLRRFRAAMIGPTQGLPPQAASRGQIEKLETLRVRSKLLQMLCLWVQMRDSCDRVGGGGIGWLAARGIPKTLSTTDESPYIFLA